jgi:hypothetical protein
VLIALAGPSAPSSPEDQQMQPAPSRLESQRHVSFGGETLIAADEPLLPERRRGAAEVAVDAAAAAVAASEADRNARSSSRSKSPVGIHRLGES